MTYGFYQVPTPQDSKGYYLYNGSRLEERSLLNVAALSYHELVPGHHFQLALTLENPRLPTFRRKAMYTAFSEGWGEYASDLAGEMGMYTDPYERAGRLSMDLFLSSRLVVDTGMNALGWSRERAMPLRIRNLDSPLLRACRATQLRRSCGPRHLCRHTPSIAVTTPDTVHSCSVEGTNPAVCRGGPHDLRS